MFLTKILKIQDKKEDVVNRKTGLHFHSPQQPRNQKDTHLKICK